MPETDLSIILPAYNEEARLPDSLVKVAAFLRSQSYSSEIIVVDDGSTDRTSEVAQKALEGFSNYRILKNPGNKGKGYSVRSGMLQAKGHHCLFSDADLSTPIEEVTPFLKQLERGYDIVIGSRALPESKLEIQQNFLRKSMGKIFNLFARLLAFRGINDSQCGFKLFTSEAAKDLFSRQTLEGFGFDVELVFLAQKLGYKILEAPVVWRNSAQSKVRIFSDSLNMFCDLLRIRWAHRSLRRK